MLNLFKDFCASALLLAVARRVAHILPDTATMQIHYMWMAVLIMAHTLLREVSRASPAQVLQENKSVFRGSPRILESLIIRVHEQILTKNMLNTNPRT